MLKINKDEKSYWYGKHLPTEMKRKISESNKGKHHSEEAKKKISIARMGEKNHNFGKKISEEIKKKMSEAHKGKRNHNYGKCLSESTKQKLSEAQKGKFVGEKSPKWKGGKIKVICKTCGKEKYFTPSLIKRGEGKFCSRRCTSIYTNIHHIKQKDTDIERLVEDELIFRSIPYTKQVPLLGITIVDFLLPHDIIIYCDGDYWHNKPEVKKRSANQDFMLTFYGYKVFRFWGKDIKKSAKGCIDKIHP